MSLKKLDNTGAVAIEAAIVLPLMVFILFATIEIYHYYRAVSIMDRAVFSIADGIAMQTELNDDGNCTATNSLCTYGVVVKDLMQPLNYEQDGEMTIRLFVAKDPSSNRDSTTWNNADGWSKRCLGSGSCQNTSSLPVAELPQNMPEPLSNDTLLMVEIEQNYDPFIISSIFWSKMGGVRKLKSQAFYRPRFSDLYTLN